MFKKTIAIAIASLAVSPAFAAVQTWSYNSSSVGSGYGNQIILNSNGVGLTTSAWSDTGGTTSPTNSPAETIQTAEIAIYSGTLGVINRDEDSGVPNHSIDSYDPNDNPSWGNDYDMILLEFDTAVSLTSFSIGWAREYNYFYQSDISLLSYTGNDAASIDGATWSSLVNGGGWISEENFPDIQQNSTVNYQSAQNTYSNYWLIGAYNNTFGSDNWTSGNDGFKLAGLTTQTFDALPVPSIEVPEPDTLLMLTSGLLVLASSRRKRATS